MQLCQEGEAGAFDQLFARFERPTLALLYRLLGDRSAAESLAQEAFLRIFKEADSYAYPRRFSTWFFTIVRNLAKNEMRYRRRHPASSLEGAAGETDRDDSVAPIADLAAPGGNPLSSIVGKEVLERVRQAISRLPEAEREALILHRFSNLKYREIAEIVGTRLGTVRSRIHSALNRLRKALGDMNSDLAAGRTAGGAKEDEPGEADDR